jgi:hypothetical protein
MQFVLAATPNYVHVQKKPSRRHHEGREDKGGLPNQSTPRNDLVAELG